MNADHSWADGATPAQLFEDCVVDDLTWYEEIQKQ